MTDSSPALQALPRLTGALVLIPLLVMLTASLWPSLSIPLQPFLLATIQSSKSVNFKIETATTRMEFPVSTNPADGKLHLPNGKHYMLDFQNIDRAGLALLETTQGKSFLSQEITSSGMTVLGSQSHRFTGGGLSLIYLLAESHMSIHSWPKHSFVAIDIYTCGESSAAERLVDSMLTLFKPRTSKVSCIKRGSNLTHTILESMISAEGRQNITLFDTDRSRSLILPATVDICVNADLDGHDCFLWRNASLLFSERTDVQLVEVVERRSGQRCLLLDGVVQFCNSADNELYTRSLIGGVMQLLSERSRDVDVYVIGGGDGWVSNHLIAVYPSIIHCWQGGMFWGEKCHKHVLDRVNIYVKFHWCKHPTKMSNVWGAEILYKFFVSDKWVRVNNIVCLKNFQSIKMEETPYRGRKWWLKKNNKFRITKTAYKITTFLTHISVTQIWLILTTCI